jgi:hypothetical protein
VRPLKIYGKHYATYICSSKKALYRRIMRPTSITPMKTLHIVTSLSILLVLIVLESCGSDTPTNSSYFQPSLDVFPDTAIVRNSGKKLTLNLNAVVSNRVCWQIDRMDTYPDSDTTRRPFIYYNDVVVTTKRPSDRSGCVDGSDTLRKEFSITFPDTGFQRLRFTRTNTRGDLYYQYYTYWVKP